jgi:hypothetical protein
VLHAQVDRELHRLLQAVGRKPDRVQRGEPVAVEPLLDAGDALIVDVDEADQVRDLGAVGIGALVLVEKADARNAEPVDLLLLLRADLAPQPGEAALAVAETLAHFLGVEVRHDGGQQLHRLVDVDQPFRLAEQRGRAYVGRQHLAVAIEDVGPRGGDGVARADTPRAVAVRRQRVEHQAARDDGEDRREGDHRETDAGARLGLPVGLAVEHRAEHAAAPRLCRLRRVRLRRAHRRCRLRRSRHGRQRCRLGHGGFGDGGC